MHEAAIITTDLLEWLLLLLIATTLVFAWRCHRAGVFSAFGSAAPDWPTITRLGIAAALPGVFGAFWLWLAPAWSAWAALAIAHLALTWYGLRWLLPDGLVAPAAPSSHGAH